MEKSDRVPVETIDETIKWAFGEYTASLIYEYLKKRNCPLHETPKKLEIFSFELRMILGTGKGQIIGSAPLLEKAIVKRLCKKLGLKFNERGPVNFAEYIKKLREYYNHGKGRKH